MKWVLLGEITGAHGIKGEVKIRSFTEDPDGLSAYGALSDANGKDPLVVLAAKATNKGVIARIEGVNDRNAAEALKGRGLYVERSQLPEPEDDGIFYWEDLKGLNAVLEDGAAYGRVVSVQNYGAGDLLAVVVPGERDEVLIPFTDTYVPLVDLKAGIVVVRPPILVGDPEPGNSDADDEAR